MRLSANPVLSGVAWVYTWFFRGHPALRAAVIIGRPRAASTPVSTSASRSTGSSWTARAVRRPAARQPRRQRALHRASSAASSASACPRPPTWPRSPAPASSVVDQGQAEAAQALGMSRGKTMRRIVLPQAMRVIVPPTGNETIAMLKDTSLLIGRCRHDRAVLPAAGHRQPHLQDLPGARRRDALVPGRCQRAHGRAVLPRAALRPRLRRPRRRARGRRRRRPRSRPARRGSDGAPTGTARRRPSSRRVNVHKSFHGTEVLKGIDLDVATGRGRRACSGRRARARRPSCAASTSSRPSTAAGSGSTAT